MYIHGGPNSTWSICSRRIIQASLQQIHNKSIRRSLSLSAASFPTKFCSQRQRSVKCTSSVEHRGSEVCHLQKLVETTAAVLVNQAEAIVRSLTNMAAADSNGYLKSNYMLSINNRRTKHYTYSYIHVRTFTKTEPVSLSNPTM